MQTYIINRCDFVYGQYQKETPFAICKSLTEARKRVLVWNNDLFKRFSVDYNYQLSHNMNVDVYDVFFTENKEPCHRFIIRKAK
jgi:hypothetical protein